MGAFAIAGFLCDESDEASDEVDAASDRTSGMGPYGEACVFPDTRTERANVLGRCAALADAFSGSLV